MVGSMAISKQCKTELGGREGKDDVELEKKAIAEGREFQDKFSEYTKDGSVDVYGHVAVKSSTGGWMAASLVLVNQGLAMLAFFGVGVNLVLFLTRVAGQNNADAANNVSKWMGTVYIFSLVGAFLSDSYWGRYKTCAIFQLIFVLGLVSLSLSTQLFLIRPIGCGGARETCGPHSSLEMGLFSFSIYLVALGNGGYQPNIATFGADQFEEGDPRGSCSKISFFSYFYLALNLGSLFSDTCLSYFQDQGMWAVGFWVSSGSALSALVLFLCGTRRYRYLRPRGNPLSRVCQVMVASFRKWKIEMPPPGEEDLYELDGKEMKAAVAANGGSKKILHSEGFRFLDRAALITSTDLPFAGNCTIPDPWRTCTVTQVEELKSVLRLLPIWLCTILYSVVFTQMASLFVEQGASMNTVITGSFRIPPASMSAFDILSVAIFIFFCRHLLQPLAAAIRRDPRGLTQLHRMGLGLVIAAAAMLAAGTVEHFRLKSARSTASSLNILWQVPQYMLVGASEVFMYVGQLEFFNEQAPEGLKSFGSALCMTSISLGNYASDLLVTMVMQITRKDGPGWIPANLNRGHMDRFYFLLAALTGADLMLYIVCARWYKCNKVEREIVEEEGDCSH